MLFPIASAGEKKYMKERTYDVERMSFIAHSTQTPNLALQTEYFGLIGNGISRQTVNGHREWVTIQR
jgi:hypothetical protein